MRLTQERRTGPAVVAAGLRLLISFIILQATATSSQQDLISGISELAPQVPPTQSAANIASSQTSATRSIPDFARKFTLLGNSTQQARIRSSLYHTFPQVLPASAASQAPHLAQQKAPHSQIGTSPSLGTSDTNPQQAARNPKPVAASPAHYEQKICIGTSNRLASSAQHNSSDHYHNLYERYNNCTHVIGNLEISWLDRGSASGRPAPDLRFLETIREITGYLLIAYVDVEKIRMPSLQIIRGRDLFKLHRDEKEEFALILIENELKSLELPNLSEILTGSVGSYNNRHLCHIRTIEWEEILNPNYKSIFVYNNGAQPECPPCDASCLGHCWAESADMCQKFSRISCTPACGGRCFGPTISECCHEFCAGGCTGPEQTDCLACKNYYDAGSCVQECPSMMRYNPSKFLWEPNPLGKFAFGATCVKECPDDMLRDNGACVRECPPNKRTFNGECVPCGGPCPKSPISDELDQLINCTISYKTDEHCLINCNSTESLGFVAESSSSSSSSSTTPSSSSSSSSVAQPQSLVAQHEREEASANTNNNNNKEHKTCKRCHAECRDGCRGSESADCLACRNVRDGPYCVAECPSHKYARNGTCQECDKSCGPDGCTGPASRLGEGGCNSCAKAIIKSAHEPTLLATTSYDIQCIQAEEPCPDGFYQEYVIGSSQPLGSPLKSSSGRPVCRKCHHRCKRCIAMGTHKSVCECAKYVAGEQCEDHCPRDYFADEQSRQCVKCSSECNGCFGPTEADCISCRVYRIYYDGAASGGGQQDLATSSPPVPGGHQQPIASAQISQPAGGGGPLEGLASGQSSARLRFNCTAQCPQDKPYRISESNMLDPYCSEDPGIDLEGQRTASSVFWMLVIFLLIISSSITFCVKIYRCQIEKDKTVKLTMHLSGIDDVEPLTPSNLKPNLAPLRSIKETELRTGKVLGSGFGGTVYQGLWYSEERETKRKPRIVAIKVLRDNGQPNMNKEFLDEAYIMASVNHPNLVRLLAVCMTPKRLMLITQLMPLGCLLDYVQKNRNEIGAKDLLEWGKQIARGMEYLEEHRMVHRDLALRNVLLQRKTHALISDFGLAKFLEVDQSEYQSGGGRLPIKWLAPECFRKRKFTHKSDVWAFGVTIWELVTFGDRPYSRIDTLKVLEAIEEGARLEKPAHVTVDVYKVMLACWFPTPEARPNFKQLAQSFVNFARDPERYLICGSKGVDWSENIMALDLDSDEGGEAGNQADELYQSDELDSSLDDEEGECSPTSFVSSQPPLGSAMPNLTPNTHNRINEMFGFQMAASHHPRSSKSSSDVFGTDVYDYLLPSPCKTNGNTVRNHPPPSNITNEEYFLTCTNYVNQRSIPQSLV